MLGDHITGISEMLLDLRVTCCRYQLAVAGAVPRLVGSRIGPFETADGAVFDAGASMETEPGVLFDALVLPAGNTGVAALMKDGRTLEFIRDQYRHGKTILALSGSGALLESAGGFASLPSGGQDPGIVSGDVTDIDALVAGFIKAVARHRHPERETDPPLV